MTLMVNDITGYERAQWEYDIKEPPERPEAYQENCRYCLFYEDCGGCGQTGCVKTYWEKL